MTIRFVAVLLLSAVAPAPFVLAQVPSPEQRGGRVHGRILPGPGDAHLPESMMITLESTHGRREVRPVHESGTFSFDGVPVGNYLISLESPGRELTRQAVTVESGFSIGTSVFVTLHVGKRIEKGDALPPAEDSTRSAMWLELDPKVRKEIEKGDQASAQGKHEEAIKCYLNALKKAPDLFSVYNNLAVEYLALDKSTQAVEALEESIRINPDHGISYRNLGALYLDEGQFEKALPHLRKATELGPEDEHAFMFLGETLYNLNRFEDALKAFVEADKQEKNPPEYYLYLGNCRLQLNRYPQALEAFHAFLKVEAESERAASVRDLVARLERTLGK